MSNEQLTANKIDSGFSTKPVIAGIDISINAGEIVAVAGPNGAGKSTLMKTLARQMRPLTGSVTLHGADIWSLTPAQFAASVAYVPQTIEPASEMTVEEIVSLGRYPHQKWWQWYASASDSEAIEKALVTTGLSDKRGKYLAELSGGERQRAYIATALAQVPRFILLDEPTSHLDFRHQLELIAILKELKQHSIGFLIVLHDLNLISRIADTVILLKTEENAPTHVCASGAPSAVLTRSALKEVFEVDILTTTDPQSGLSFLIPMPLSE